MTGDETTTPIPSEEPLANQAPKPTSTSPVASEFKGRDWQGYIVLVAGVGALLWGLFSALGVGMGLWEWGSR